MNTNEYDFEEKINEERFHQVYDQLVDQTDNRATLFDRRKNQLLKDMLELMEYLRGEDETNPLDSWFSED